MNDEAGISDCDDCGMPLLVIGQTYADGEVVSCPECGLRHRVNCDSENAPSLEALDEGDYVDPDC